MRNANVVDTLDYSTLDRLEARQRFHLLFSDPPDDIEQTAMSASPVLERHRVLDVGCGTGSFLERLARGSAGVTLIGADISKAAVAAVAARGISVVHADVRSMPFTSDSFNTCFARHLFQHVDDVPAAMSECRRVTTQQGRFVVVVNHRDQAPLLSSLISAAVASHGLETPSIPSFDPRVVLLAMHREFGNCSTHDVCGSLVFPEQGPLISFAESLLSFYGIPVESPRRADVLSDIAERIAQRFRQSNEPWRDSKGYSVSIAVKY